MARKAPSPDLDALKLSPEVAYYLKSRRIPFPTCPPAIKTPEPRLVPGARFDPARVDKFIRAMGQLRHTQGQWAGRPLKLDPWQVAYIIAPVFGWVRPLEDGDEDEDGDGYVRIIRGAYVDVPRKNGKTTLASGVGLYLTCADGEPGAQVYAVAAGKDQAKFCFDPAKTLASKSPALKPFTRPLAFKILHPGSGSYFAVVSKVADLMHGANIHGAVVDELHVHKDPQLLETVESGTGSRRQPLVLIITTADDGKQGTIYARRRRYIEQLAVGVISDPSTYGVVWAAGEADDPFAESTWRKANPGYGISPTVASMESAAAKAQQSPADLSSFLRLRLGRRTKQETKYLRLDAWDRNAGLVDELALVGRECFGGLDLASTSDLTALAWDFPDGTGGHDVIWRHWIPEGALEELNRRTAGEAEVWVREGWLKLTPGDVTDYDFIRAQINTDSSVFGVATVAYDPWNSSQLVNDLVSDGVQMAGCRQGFQSMSGPTKDLQHVLLLGQAESPKYRHGGNPLVRWQVDNFAAAMDPAGNVKPDKKNSGDKIDGLVAGVMALFAASKPAEEAEQEYAQAFSSGRAVNDSPAAASGIPGGGRSGGPRSRGSGTARL